MLSHSRKAKEQNFPYVFFIDDIEFFFLTYDVIEKEVLLQMSCIHHVV
jgi:hypothetical protein